MVQAARKITAKDPEEKLAHRWLTVLELALLCQVSAIRLADQILGCPRLKISSD